MRNLIMALGAFSLAVPAAVVLPAGKAEAQRTYHGKKRHYSRSDRGRCRHSSGTTGLVAGGAGGALLGNSVLGHGALGTVAGAVGGAFAGRAIDRSMTAKERCR